ncbi:DUF3160 domain-containing protein [Candidatus Fermentibacteria bacterium]|nr:DUF3160 domain-containing protein [Candidatus Fermentibacteria bacterium]
MRPAVTIILAAMLLSASSVSCTPGSGSATSDREILLPRPESGTEDFGQRFYQPVESTVDPHMPSCGLPVDRDEVINLSEVMSCVHRDSPPSALLENGFAVFGIKSGTDDPVEAFEIVSDWDQPVYVSAGIPLHLLHIFFDQLLQEVEVRFIYGDLRKICQALYEHNLRHEDDLSAAYFAVAAALLDTSFVSDQRVAQEVSEELDLIEAHQGFSESPIFGYEEDYSQYVPRGHYTVSDSLRRYFRSMMWLGRMTFLLNGGEPHGPAAEYLVSREVSRAQTAAAVTICSDLATMSREGKNLLQSWRRIYEVTAFFAGFADDLTVTQYLLAAGDVAGESVSSEQLRSDEFYDEFRRTIVEDYPPPKIYSGTGASVIMPDLQGNFDPGDFVKLLGKTAGMRFLGQRYAFDSEILGKLVFPSVGSTPEDEERFMPSGLDVAAVFGSPTAEEVLRSRGAFDYAYYADSLQSLRDMVDDMTAEDWHATLYNTWLHALYVYQDIHTVEDMTGYPDFMRTEAWRLHALSNFLASWAMLRHDTILYVKQSYTPLAGAAPPPPQPSAGFVEPVPEVYAEIRAALRMATAGLTEYDMLDQQMEYQLMRADRTLERLQSIAERELAGNELTSDDAEFLENLADELESLTSLGNITESGTETSLVADVHTDQNTGSVLEVASGNLDLAVVVYARPDGAVEAAVGPVLSYYEFTWPMEDRLPDEAWREMLSGGEVERPEWTAPYLLQE